ncbi:phosphatase PAP2 family protein [Acuticoccus sediminis]|uniref:hypothetical protein n=1 Tax=Acuticoccus sediminis TaxID=2184697 RepID=UPI001CFDDB08|nr:hypothetical protein [Acuticoccus sediminis]
MNIHLKPQPDEAARASAAAIRRDNAKAITAGRPRVDTKPNGEINRYGTPLTNYHKGLPHDAYGVVDLHAFKAFVTALNREGVAPGTNAEFDVPLGPVDAGGAWPGHRNSSTAVHRFYSVVADGRAPQVRNWESPLAGHVFDLEGPDAGSVGMAPAPRLPFSELCAEMAELYAMALLRDVPFASFTDPDATAPTYDANGNATPQNPSSVTVGAVQQALAGLSWLDPEQTPYSSDGTKTLNEHEERRRNARFKNGQFTPHELFRGSTHGAKEGPYLSQFMLMGSASLRGDQTPPEVASLGADPGQDAPVPSKRTVSARDPRTTAPLALQPGVEAPVAAEDAGAFRAGRGGPPAPATSAGLGFVTYGAQSIHQRISAQRPGRDYMTDWPLWLDVQNGADTRENQTFFADAKARFIHTPRALATYVHFDALYQAYFVACLLMLDGKVPFDHGFPSGPYHATRGSFATFGGPHILSLMTEVATRGLKAVRRQKFQHHLRGRPEQLAAMLTLAASGHADAAFGAHAEETKHLKQMVSELQPLLTLVAQHNAAQNAQPTFPRRATEAEANGDGGLDHWAGFEIAADKNYLLPMAFPEGSPMHASYGAGHATVAGACITILKAFFEMSSYAIDGEKHLASPLADPTVVAAKASAEGLFEGRTFASVYPHLGGKLFQPPRSDDPAAHVMLAPEVDDPGVTLQGELDKLAANISIGRNMAGVHYYTDYYDSLRLGERIAVGILQEHMSTYSDPLTMRLPTFDDDCMVISGDGKGGGSVHLIENGALVPSDAWWTRHVPA